MKLPRPTRLSIPTGWWWHSLAVEAADHAPTKGVNGKYDNDCGLKSLPIYLSRTELRDAESVLYMVDVIVMMVMMAV